MENTNILSMTFDELSSEFKEQSIPGFRSKQVWDWLHKHYARSYDEMMNLPKDLREKLKQNYPIPKCDVEMKQEASDGTVKFLFAVEDDDYIECVVMKYKYGYTICVSSQVGCKMGCAFCASTIGGFKRSLSAGEILSQVYVATRELGERISHIVLMGMGEPMDNFDNVMRFISLVTNENGMNLSMRNISLSTCGVIPGIRRLMGNHLQLTLSVSLHAPNNEIRDTIMPVNKRYRIEELLAVCKEYEKRTSRRISFEYAMLSGINDSEKCAEELGKKLKGTLCHVNLIPVNEVEESPFKPRTPETVERFIKVLARFGVTATVRRKLGSDIDASCGQLRRRKNKERRTADEDCC